MSWERYIQSQEKVVKILLNSFKRDRLSHAYLFEGSKGTGKKDIAIQLAKTYFCKQKKQLVEPCNQCSDCKRISSGNHPDVHIVKPDGQTIKIEQIRHLKKEFSYRGMETSKKFYLIEESDKMTTSAANALLKFLEEPDSSLIAVLLTTESRRMLKTILSRTQILSFSPLTSVQLMGQLLENGASEPIAKLLVHITSNYEEAYKLYQEDWIAQARAIVIQLVEEVCTRPHQVLLTLQSSWLLHFKEKDQIDLGLDLLLLWYRDVLRTLITNDDQLIFVDQIDKLQQQALNSSYRQITQQLSYILETKRRLNTNVNPQLLLEQLVLRLQEGS